MKHTNIEKYRREVFVLDDMSKSFKEKTRRARKIKRKHEIQSIDKIPIIKVKFKPKIQLKALRIQIYIKNRQNS